MSEDQVLIFDEILEKEGCQRLEIPYSSIHEYSWDSLVAKSHSYIRQYSALYDDLEQLLTKEGQQLRGPGLIEINSPDHVKSKIPKRRSYQGKSTDWGRKREVSEAIGIAGEQLVKQYEQNKLRDLGLDDLADRVEKVKDGKGYDIKSFNKEGVEIHIEVKTTCYGIDEPFYFTINERDYFIDHGENAYLYRLCNFNPINNRADFYRFSAEELLDMEFTPLSFEVSKAD